MRVKGFTLVEMVMVMVVMGIIFLGITGFIELGAKGYVDTVDRQKVQNQARFAIEKLSREIRHGIPNSFATVTNSVGDKCLEFYPIARSGFYSQNEVSGRVDFIIGNQGERLPTSNSEKMVINPSRIEDLTSETQSVSLANCRNSSNDECTEEEKSSGVFVYSVDDDFDSHSIARRYYSFNGKVTYCISTTGMITRNGISVADGINHNQSSFSYLDASLQRSGLVHLDFLFTNPEQDEQSFYKHDVQVLNVP
ncbi:MSHA biogenesis protein MshO [Vibrio sp. MACH09]|uniref:PilW family protein n=1 Tax=Vibrio sp. MACH09 TaxID=3025122 RepID=UPI002791AF78|nr:prepilin-type N-terminal cleavage/methylation domain-containing protein [Vibrio sp. MACH09]GLO59766.1 MSHA biogenesis protein MshO [Vibrio sp. MACH09]